MCSRVSCGLEPSHVYDLRDALDETSQNGYDFTCIPIVHPRLITEHKGGVVGKREGPYTRPDLLLTTSEWSSLVVGVLNRESCYGCDSNCRTTVVNSEQAILQELTLAAHVNMPAVMVTLTSDKSVNLARLIHNKIVSSYSFQVWARVPMVAPKDQSLQFRSDMCTDNALKTDTWTWWHRFHSVANVEKKIGLCLELSADLPDKEIIDRWLGEPVKCTILPTDIWLTNKKGFPVLSPAHQSVVKRLYSLHTQFVVTGHLRHGNVKFYQQYLDHIIQASKGTEIDDPLVQYARGYEDYLQCPLQPLMDNLESQTYEVFEKDPIKYQEYERAIHDALLDRVPEESKDDITVVLMVVGAGRGPLVRRAIVAASQADRNIKLYAVEKNPNAVLTLFALKDMEWGDRVEVVSCDMREWNPPEKADILVSELLGSFSDNELSPECLDGAQKFLKDDGICIPQSYTSFIAPLQSPKLFNEIRSCREKDKHFLCHLETPYVVFMHNKREIAPSQPLFTFSHPNKDAVIDNSRQGSRQFKVTEDSVVHGIAGYFEATLYKEVKLSIRPETHSPGMFSWFPILFPIKEPLKVHAGDVVEINFWRCVSKKNVWYEWCITEPTISAIHNPNGRSYTIGL